MAKEIRVEVSAWAATGEEMTVDAMLARAQKNAYKRRARAAEVRLDSLLKALGREVERLNARARDELERDRVGAAAAYEGSVFRLQQIIDQHKGETDA